MNRERERELKRKYRWSSEENDEHTTNERETEQSAALSLK